MIHELTYNAVAARDTDIHNNTKCAIVIAERRMATILRN